MTPPRCRGAAKAGALAAVLACLLLAVPVPAAQARAATPAASTPGTTMTLLSQPAWVAPDGQVTVKVRITDPPPGARVVTTLYDRLPTMAALQRSLFATFTGAVTPNGLDSQSLDDLHRASDGSVQLTVSFALSPDHGAPPKLIYVPAPQGGVYPLDLVLKSRSGKQLTQLVTWIVRLPEASAAAQDPLQVALVLPLRAAPSHLANASIAVDGATRNRTRSLLQGLEAAGGAPVTLAPTPEVLDALGASTSSTDNDLLDQLRILANGTGNSVLGGPYVDLDLPAWLRQPTLRDRATVERSRGVQTLQDRLGTAPLSATALAPADLTNDAVRWLYGQGVRKVVVPAAAVDTTAALPTRPFSLGSAAGTPLQAMAVNGTAEAGFAMTDRRRGLQEVLATLAQTALDAPSGAQGTVLAPLAAGPAWSADPQQLEALLHALTTAPTATDAAPFVRLVPLSALFKLPTATRGGRSATPVTLQPADAEPPSLAAFDQHFATVAHQLASFRQMLATTGSTVATNTGLLQATAFDQLLGTAGAGELSPAARSQFLDGVAATLHHELAKVAAPAHQTVTLTSRTGSIPITLHNTLGYPVQVVVQVESGERLAFPDGTTQKVTLTGENTPVEIRVHTRTSGDVPLTITVTSPDGNLVLATTDYTVRSTAVSGVGLALTIGALLVLLSWWVRSWRRNRRSGRRARPRPEPTN